MNRWYMQNPESLPKNEMQTDQLISARRPDLIKINKKEKLQNCELYCPGWPRVKLKEGEQKAYDLDGYTNHKKDW